MDISRTEQRILHLMAQGGRIEITRDNSKKIETASCFTRDGWVYPGFGLELFRKLNREDGVTIIQVTHSEKNAEYGTRIINLLDGRVESSTQL